VLTKPSKPCKNEGYDNEDYDYILYVNDILGSADGHRYGKNSSREFMDGETTE
jgi:dual specificity protein kinase YAK1